MTLDRRTLLAAAASAFVLPSLARAEAQEVTRGQILNDPDQPVLGNPDGDVTLVEYFDYQCPYCKKSHPMVKRVVEEDGGVRLVLKDWPIFGPPSVQASHLALGAVGLGKYEAANDALMSTAGRLDDELIRKTLREGGVDPDAAAAAYRRSQAKWDALLRRNGRQADALRPGGTPAFIVGDSLYPGAIDEKLLRKAVAMARG